MTARNRRGLSIELTPADYAGLRPRAWICVGAGFAREDLKAKLLGQGGGFVGEAVTSLTELAVRVTNSRKDRVLGSLARQEVLRFLLADRRLSARFPELKRLRRQGSFFRRLDYAIQAGRLSFAHEDEAEVYKERVAASFGINPLRGELEILTLGYEAFLEERGLLDPPLLLRKARGVLEEGWPERLSKPERIDYYTIQRIESLEASFWEAIGRFVEIRTIGVPPVELAPDLAWSWERWHTADDAAERLAETLALEAKGDWNQDCILIPETGSVRRSLNRALESLGVPQADPRDPTRIRWDETIKWALLPLQVVARGFERIEVLEYLRTFEMRDDFFKWSREIGERGIRQGLPSYARGSLTQVHAMLSQLQGRFGGRKTCIELAKDHLAFLRERVRDHEEALWILGFFEMVWAQFAQDTAWVDRADRRAPLLYWVERLQARVAEAPPPVEKSKPKEGVAVYRLNQAPIQNFRRIWVLGLSTDALSGSVGDYWFSEREREVLSAEFAVRSGAQARRERLGCLRAWIAGAEQVTFLDAAYDTDGRERESLRPLLQEVIGPDLPEGPIEKGAHERWLPSFSPFRPESASKVQLPPRPPKAGAEGAKPEVTATTLDDYSSCAFLALAKRRWELWDQMEPDTELAGHVRGNILHEAVRLLLASREGGVFNKSSADALNEAWVLKPPRGLLRGDRVERYVKARMVDILDAFKEKEREYAERAGTKVVSMEDRKLRLEFEDFAVIGTPDRIDEHPAGLFIIDYKTSSLLPSGGDMVDLGYRLQLPFYALATKRETGKQVVGVQFVELNRKAGRGKGIFFKAYNGKDAGKLTKTTGASHSLLDRVPDDVWAVVEEKIVSHARAYFAGNFDAAPKKRTECETCKTQDLCGFRRLSLETEGEGAGG